MTGKLKIKVKITMTTTNPEGGDAHQYFNGVGERDAVKALRDLDAALDKVLVFNRDAPMREDLERMNQPCQHTTFREVSVGDERLKICDACHADITAYESLFPNGEGDEITV